MDRVSEELPIIYLARHGETPWSLNRPAHRPHRFTADRAWREQCRRLRERLSELTFARVFTSPLQRARRTCELAGFGSVAEIDHDLVEWDYGEYEVAVRSRSVRNARNWQLFRRRLPGRRIATAGRRAG